MQHIRPSTYNASAPAAPTIEQHFVDTMAQEHTVLKDRFLDGSAGSGSEVSGSAEADQPRLTPLESELTNAVNDQYGQFGITAEDLRTYLDVSLDIEDAISVGRKADIQQDRYKVYKTVDRLIKFGPDKSPEELDRLNSMAEEEMLTLPWPSTMTRNYLKQKHGAKFKKMIKTDQSRYDQVCSQYCVEIPCTCYLILLACPLPTCRVGLASCNIA